MHFPTIRLVAAKEILELLRDRRTIISTILIPILAMPLLIGGMALVARNQVAKLQQETVPVVVRGLATEAGVPQVLAAIPRLEAVPDPDPGLAADSLIARGTAQLVLDCDSSLAQAFGRLRHTKAADSTDAISTDAVSTDAVSTDAVSTDAVSTDAPDTPAIRVYYNSTVDEAAMAARELAAGLKGERNGRTADWLEQQGITGQALEPWVIRELDVASAERRSTEMIARFLPYLILVLVIQSLAYPAMELTAGEKERHTIETLLVNPVSRTDLVLGKFIAVATLGVGSSVFTLGSELAILLYLNARVDMLGGFPFSLSPYAAGVAILFLLPFTLFFAALSLLVCLYARSMKEAQSYVAPMMMLVIFPSMMSMIPGLELTPLTALVPVYNVTLMLKQVLVQDWSQAPMMALVFLANGVYAALAIWATVVLFRRESVIFRS